MGQETRDLERPAKAAGRSSRLMAQGLRSGASPKKCGLIVKISSPQNQKPSSALMRACRRAISRFLRSQLRRIGLGHPPGRDPVRTIEPDNDSLRRAAVVAVKGCTIQPCRQASVIASCAVRLEHSVSVMMCARNWL